MDKGTNHRVGQVVVYLMDGTHQETLVTDIHEKRGATYGQAWIERGGKSRLIRVTCEDRTWYEVPER